MMGSDRCPIGKRHAHVLKSLTLLPRKEREILLRYINLQLTRCICECAYNVLKGNVPLDSRQKEQLQKHADILRQLVRKGEKLGKKRKIIQTGGGAFLPALLGPVIATVLAKLFE